MTMVVGTKPPRTTASSDELPYQWDQLQYQHGEGPCLEAIATNNVARWNDRQARRYNWAVRAPD